MSVFRRDQIKMHPWFSELQAKEMELLDPDVRSNSEQVRKLLHDDFLEFGSTGRVYNKKMLLEMLQREQHAKVSLREFAVRELSPDTALVTYRTVGQSGREARRSSVWIRQEGQWRMAFHQGTRISGRGA